MKDRLNELAGAMDKNFKYCDWVNSQTVENYLKQLESEVDELKKAVKNKDRENIKEEIGDIFWDVFAISRLAGREFGFDEREPIDEVIAKFRRRKPYIFEGRKVTLEEAHRLWHDSKKKEKDEKIKKK